jgi:hypothetical protein
MIDITKKYQTRSGLPVRIYAVDGGGICPVHGAIKDDGGWYDDRWRVGGSYTDGGVDDPRDLVIAKSWRAWKEGEGPVRLMYRNKTSADRVTLIGKVVDGESRLWYFRNAIWLHEDGSETPCGVCE